jgi:hypothetical protein
MKLAVEVRVPPTVAVDTALLAELIGSQRVISLLREGKIQPGQRRNKSGHHHHGSRRVSDAEVAAARVEYARETEALNAIIQGATK